MLGENISLGCRPRRRPRSRPRSVWQRASQTLFFDYENEDDDEDEKQSTRHFRHLPLESLPSNCPAGAAFAGRSLGKNLGPYELFLRILWQKNPVDHVRYKKLKRLHSFHNPEQADQ